MAATPAITMARERANLSAQIKRHLFEGMGPKGPRPDKRGWVGA